MTFGLKLAVGLVAIAMAIAVALAWKDARQQQAALQAELKATQQALADATARQSSRDAALNTLLAQMKKAKATVQKPEQVIAALPPVLPLPQPLALSQPLDGTSNKAGPEKGNNPSTHSGPGANKPAAPTVEFPASDLKPLYDFAVDCKACQAQLAAAQADLKDERTKGQALSRERDDALRAAKGGSALRRIGRAGKWFALGAAAGAIAAKVAR